MTRLLALALLIISAPALAGKADWTRTIAATPEGGYRVGNPKAPVKVIEFFSLTCSHCRHFVEVGLPPLKSNYIAGGKVSLEFRNFVLNGPDIAASLLMRCTSPAKAVGMLEAVYADQDGVFAGATALSSEATERIEAVPSEKRPAAYAREGGIDRWFMAHGLKPSRANACLADKAGQARLMALRDRGVKENKIEGTPGFVVNGKTVDGPRWEDLEPAIKDALAKTGG